MTRSGISSHEAAHPVSLLHLTYYLLPSCLAFLIKPVHLLLFARSMFLDFHGQGRRASWAASATRTRSAGFLPVYLSINPAAYRGFPTRMVYLCYISCLRYTILAGNPRYFLHTFLRIQFVSLVPERACFVSLVEIFSAMYRTKSSLYQPSKELNYLPTHQPVCQYTSPPEACCSVSESSGAGLGRRVV